MIDDSLCKKVVDSALKKAVTYLLFKRQFLGLTLLDNFYSLSNLPFLGEIIERMVSTQLERAPDEADYLEYIQTRFWLGHSTETGLVTHVNDLWRTWMGVGESFRPTWSLQQFLISLTMISGPVPRGGSGRHCVTVVLLLPPWPVSVVEEEPLGPPIWVPQDSWLWRPPISMGLVQLARHSDRWC